MLACSFTATKHLTDIVFRQHIYFKDEILNYQAGQSSQVLIRQANSGTLTRYCQER